MDGFFFCTCSYESTTTVTPDIELLFSSVLRISSLITSSTNGYDGSMMNALESEKQWNNFFGKPEGSKLGLFNAIQACLFVPSYTCFPSLPGTPFHGFKETLTALFPQNIGSLAGYPFAPYLADGVGRRGGVFVGAFIMCIAVSIQTAAQSIGMFIGARPVHYFVHNPRLLITVPS